MAAERRSLQITRAYQERVAGISERAVRDARRRWAKVELVKLEPTFDAWRSATSAAVTQAQLDAVRASIGYLGAFISSETRRLASPPRIDPRRYAGLSRDGRPLTKSLETALIAVKVGLKDGGDQAAALKAGRNRALLAVSLDTWQAARFSLADGIKADDRIDGWRRAVTGTCAACLGLAERSVMAPGEALHIHPGCQCVSEANIRNAPDRYPRPTGAEIFAALTADKQDEQVGHEKAQLLRDDAISLRDLVAHSPQETTDDFITERPLADLPTAAKADERNGRDA